MTDLQYTIVKKTHIEELCRKNFKVDLCVKDILFDDITTGKNSYTTIFNTEKNEMFAVCVSYEPLNLADVKHMVKSMGIEAETYLPPNADNRYFLHCGYRAFLKVFPGLTSWKGNEALFYQTLAPYNPALVKIAKINGEVRRYNTYGSRWQKDFEFSYARIRVQ